MRLPSLTALIFVASTPVVAATEPERRLDFLTAEPGIGGVLFPHLHALGSFGGSTGEPSALGLNDHDPQSEATLQAFEPGLSLRTGKLHGYVNGTGITDADGDFSFTLEEGFLKLVDLPLGLQLRGGQYLNRFGFQNSVHNHGWHYVDQNLVNGRFLNEGELVTRGGELTIDVPVRGMKYSAISASVGDVSAHEHGHGEEGHGGEGHGGEAEFEAGGARFTDRVVTATWVNQYDISDHRRITGILSGAWGDNEFGRTTQVYGLGIEYLWRENGYGNGGDSLRWRNELMYRHIGAVSGHLPGEEEESGHGGDGDHHREGEHDDEERSRRASLDEFGLYTSLIYGIDDKVETGIRAGWVSGISEAGLDDRFRLSPVLTWYANEQRTLQARLQYNWDHLGGGGDEHSIWFQLGFNWGAGHVR